MSRGRKLKLNIMTSLLNQAASIVSGFILLNFFLRYYGSNVNGLVSSITQFLAVISLCECGVGAVVQAALYKPIAENNEKEISRIYKSSTRFFNNISKLLIGYMIILIIVFPLIINKSFSPIFTGILIVAITLSMFAQFYFAITYKLILNAAQLSYVQMIAGTVTIVINIIVSVFLMKIGSSIQIVKLISSLIYLVQPIVYKKAVDKYYKIDKNIEIQGEPLKQKWNGFSQHIATVVLENTDVMVLTFFSTLSNVSIYAIYHLVTNGIKLVFTSIATNMKSLLGDMYARNEMKLLDDTFSNFEWITHTSVTFVYSVSAILIVPFVRVYTRGVTDANYILPLFGALMCLAMAVYTIRLPYSQMVLAVGHFKQTQNSAIIEAVLNLLISIVVVSKYGLIGVAIGTIVAVLYRTIYFVWYLSRNILERKVTIFIKQAVIDILMVICIYYCTAWISLKALSYLGWVVMAIKVSCISLAIVVIISLLFARKNIKWCISEINKKK